MTAWLMLALTVSAAPATPDTTEVLPNYGTLAAGTEAPWLAGWTLDDSVWNIDQTAASERTVLVFWATWCAPCREGLQRLASESARLDAAGVQVVLINLDTRQTVVTRFLDEQPLPYTCVLDPFQLNTRGFFGLPTTGADTLALPRTVILDGDRRVHAILGREGADYVDLLVQDQDPLVQDEDPGDGEFTPTRR